MERKGLTFRSILIAIALMTVLGVWAQYIEYFTQVAGSVSGAASPTGIAVPAMGPVLGFLLVLVLGRWMVRSWKRWVLDKAEVLVIYSMLMVAVPVMAFGLTYFLFPVLTGQAYAGKVGQDSTHMELMKGVPKWMTVQDEDAVREFWRGADEGRPRPSGFFARGMHYLRGGVPWGVWLPLLRGWLPLLLALFLSMLCIAAVMRRQWVEAERLPFPQTVAPLALLGAGVADGPLAAPGVSPVGGILRQRAFWVAAAVPILLYSVNGLHEYFPSVPEIRTSYRLGEIITEKPWSAMTLYWNFIVDPLAIGLACLITFEVSFSFLFFFGLTRLELLWGELFGLTGYRGNSQFWSSETYPFTESQCTGASVAFGVAALWMARRYLGRKLRAMFAAGGGDEPDEAMRTRTALPLFVISTAVFVAILSMAGMSWWFALLVFAMYMCFAITVAKVRADAGLAKNPYTDHLFYILGGSAVFGIASLNQHSLLYFLSPGIVLILLAIQVESFRMCDAVGLRRSAMAKALTVAFVAAFLIGSYSLLVLTYRHGQAKMMSYPSFAGAYAFSMLPYDLNIVDGVKAASLLDEEEGAAAAGSTDVEGRDTRPLGEILDFAKIGAMGAGAFITGLLTFLRYTVMKWPLHPVGYILSVSRAADYWSSVLIAVAIKWALLKWGGLRLYEKAKPAFVGLIVGALAIRAVWAVVATISAFHGAGGGGA